MGEGSFTVEVKDFDDQGGGSNPPNPPSGSAPVYSYISSGLLPAKKSAARRVIVDAEQYVLVEGVLFRLTVFPESDDSCKLSLAVPESMAAQIISLYHDSLLEVLYPGVV